MGSGPLPFPPDWLPGWPERAISDLDLALLLVNSLDQLEDPPDRLHDLRWFSNVLRSVGQAPLAEALSDRDLPSLRRLRDALRQVFESDDSAVAATLLNPLLTRSRAVALLVPDAGTGAAALAVAPDRFGLAALEARLPAALATFVAERGPGRLGTCESDPCSCAFVDRTRAATRRYCCSYCNDRAAARNYRARLRNDHVD